MYNVGLFIYLLDLTILENYWTDLHEVLTHLKNICMVMVKDAVGGEGRGHRRVGGWKGGCRGV